MVAFSFLFLEGHDMMMMHERMNVYDDDDNDGEQMQGEGKNPT